MAAKKTTKEVKEYVDFVFSKGENFDYSGRLYKEKSREAGKLTITPMSLCLNGLITIKGCSLMETDKNVWISGPQYKSGDEYKDYLYIDKSNNEDMEDLANYLQSL